MAYRVVYGETMPAWERKFTRLRDAKDFANKQRSLGDVVFSVAKIIPGEEPKSLLGSLPPHPGVKKNG